MSKSANKTLVGAFVIGALALLVIAVIIFGGGKLFADKETMVMYFSGSVKGLNVGSPVVFRGVKVGTVKDIVLQFNTREVAFLIPVYIELDYDKIDVVGDTTVGEKAYFDQLIEKGLRAQLELQSIVTGQLMINLDFNPKAPARFVGIDKRYREIPTASSGLEELLKTAQELPLKELFDKLLKAIEGIEKIVNSPNISSSLVSLDASLAKLKDVLEKVDKDAGPIMANLKEISQSIKKLAKEGESVPGQLNKTLVTAQDALRQGENAMASIKNLTADNSALSQELGIALRDVSSAARSLRYLTDYLQKHPESLIQGKKAKKGE
jgi:paraquat-inducible protein B